MLNIIPGAGKRIMCRFLACCALVMVALPIHAELILTAPPRESAEDGKRIYEPLAAELGDLLGERVVYQQPKGWLFYQRDMRADKYDIVFDGPHFISWRMQQFGHQPVAKLPGKLGFVVIAAVDNALIENLDSLVNKPLCVIAPPNLSALTVLANFDNPVRQPRLVTVKGGMKGVYQAFKDGKCDAAVLRDKYLNKKVPAEEHDRLKVIYSSEPVSNQGITVSKRIDADKIALLSEALTVKNDGSSHILKRFSPKADSMIAVGQNDYDEHYKLLTGIVFGWEIRKQ